VFPAEIVDLSDEELIKLGFSGDSEPLRHYTRSSLTPVHLVDVAPGVKSIVDAVRADPDHLGSKSLQSRLSFPTYIFFRVQA
jgi:hypothetical protein